MLLSAKNFTQQINTTVKEESQQSSWHLIEAGL